MDNDEMEDDASEADLDNINDNDSFYFWNLVSRTVLQFLKIYVVHLENILLVSIRDVQIKSLKSKWDYIDKIVK